MTKSQKVNAAAKAIKVEREQAIQARVAKLDSAIKISRSNAKYTRIARFRKLALAKAMRLTKRQRELLAQLTA